MADAWVVRVGEKEMAQKGCQRSLRRAGGTVFLPLKGIWRSEKLFCAERERSVSLESNCQVVLF